MQDRRVLTRYVGSGIFIVLAYAIATTVAGALYEFVLHLRHLDTTVLKTIIQHAEHLNYLLWAIIRPNGFTNIALLLVGLFVAWEIYRTIYLVHGESRRKYKQRAGYASHGTSRWQEKEEVTEHYQKDLRGVLLGAYYRKPPKVFAGYTPVPKEMLEGKHGHPNYVVHPYESRLNQNYLVFGPPGSNKTTGFVLPNIFHQADQGINMVVTDPKGELYELTAEYCRQRGYNIVVLDYLHFKYGHRQNLLNYIFAEEQYAELANMYLGATRNEGDKRDFWEEKAEELFTALIGFVHQAYGGQGTLTDVYRLIPEVMDPQYAMTLFKKHKIHGAPLELMRGVLSAAKSENTMASIAATLGGRLRLFAQSNVRSQTSTTDYDLRKLAEEKTILYVWISDSQKTYSPIISVFWTILFNTLYEQARLTGGKLPIPVKTLIDEMANIGKIADFDTKLTTMRSRRIYPMMIWHSYPQLKLKYGQDYADAIMGASDTKVLLACGDMPTADLFSKYLGKTTIETQSRRGAKTLMAEQQNATNQFTGRDLLQPSELLSLDRDYSVVVQSGLPPVLLNKVQYRYWEELICEHASKEQLPQYTLDNDFDEDDMSLQEAAQLILQHEEVSALDTPVQEEAQTFTGVDVSKFR